MLAVSSVGEDPVCPVLCCVVAAHTHHPHTCWLLLVLGLVVVLVERILYSFTTTMMVARSN